VPIKIGKKVHHSFESAARHVARSKGIPIKRARAYTAVVDSKQNKGMRHPAQRGMRRAAGRRSLGRSK